MLENEYLITETIMGSPGRIIKGPGLKFLNPLTNRPRILPFQKAATSLNKLLKRHQLPRTLMAPFEKVPFQNTARIQDVSLRTADGKRIECEIYYEYTCHRAIQKQPPVGGLNTATRRLGSWYHLLQFSQGSIS